MATGAEIASAYVALTVRAPGIQRDIAKELGSIDMPGLGRKMGSRLGDGIKKSLTVAGAAAGGVLAAGVGASFLKGISRLNAIDQATAKLRGLGNSASDVDKIMGNALASVRGTAFGLDAAATTAAGAVAAGIAPGEQLESVLKSVANSAAASGSSMDEMGSIYNKVASLGKAQNDVLQQVADRGIPIYQALADQMGVTTDEIFKMASAGDIGFTEFESAMTRAAGTVADEMGNTVSGSWANFMASLGRVGAGALGGIWSSLAPVLQATTNAMGPLEEVAARAGEKLGSVLAPAVEWLVETLNSSVDFSMFTPVGLVFEALAPVLPVLSDAFKALAEVVGGVLAEVLPPLMPVFKDLAGVFATLVQTVLPPLVSIFEALSPVIELFGTIVAALAPIITPLVQIALLPLTMALKPLTPLFELLGKVIEPIANLINGLLTPVIDWMTTAMEGASSSISEAANGFIPQLGVAFQTVWAVVKPVVDWFGRAFTWLWQNVLSPVFGFIRTGIAVVGGVIQGVYDTFIKPVVDRIAAGFNWLWSKTISPVIAWIQEKWRILGLATQLMWQRYIQPAFKAIGDALNWVWVNIISPVVDWIRRKWEILGAATRLMYEQYIKPAWDKVASIISSVWNKVKNVIDTMVRVIKSDPKKAFEAARDAIGKAWNGIRKLAKDPVVFVVKVVNGLIDTVNKILPKDLHIPNVSLPKGFSDGGYTGNLAPSAVAGVVHGNEHVIRAASRQKIESRHPGLLDHMNQYGSIPGYRKGGLVNPLPKGSYSVSQPYHGGHNGIDLAAPSGTKVFAAGSGTVGLAGSVNMGGNEVYIQHDNGLGTRYSHLSRFGTRVGAKVKAGNVIGYVGSTGMSTGPHLHYMVHNPGGGGGNYGNHVNPAAYLGMQGKDLGEAGGAASILDGLVDWAVGKIKGAFPGGGLWVDVATAMAKDAAGKMAKAFNPFAAADGHTTLYDNGGWLPTGRSLVENKTGRPEPILTGSQWDALLDGGAAGGARRVTVRIGSRDFEGWMDERADAAVDRGIEDEMRSERFASYR